MIYNFNLGIGWASSGVEYAESYRAKMLREIHQPAKFVFTDMFPRDSLALMTENIGFLDQEIIWLYTYFTDFEVAKVTYSTKEFQKTLPKGEYRAERQGKRGRIFFEGSGNYVTLYFTDEEHVYIHRVEYVSENKLIRKDYFQDKRIYTEYYAPESGKAKLYMRRFFNRDGSTAYEEMLGDEGEESIFRFPDRILYSKQELIGYMVQSLCLGPKDTVIIDRATGLAQPILENVNQARVGVVIHADHFSEGSTSEDYILWNNYYDYVFTNHDSVDFYITATDQQNQLLCQQFEKYIGVRPKVITIPVGSLSELKYPKGKRDPHRIISASRLAREKHIDWVILACVKGHETIHDLSLDIYGVGGEEGNLKNLIEKNHAGDYIHLMGQKDLTDTYVNYGLYLSGSTSEGFGLSLMEAIGSGCPIIGFDVRYGNPTFIRDGENGYLIPLHDRMTKEEKVDALCDKMLTLFKRNDLDQVYEKSYERAREFLTREVMERWNQVCSY
jgi:accessory Sec system glycosylation protein GtfA